MDERAIHDILSGRRTTLGAVLLRGLLALAEPAYATAMSARNWLYDRGIFKAHRAGAAVISVGNITTGGTGKTPMVRWLAEHLRLRGLPPAVLMRGYKGKAGWSDEQDLLRKMLGDVPVMAEPDRVAGAARLLQEHPQVRAVLLDDGFQHRRLARDFDLVLVDATNPFGFGHVLPRGLLRERLSGLRRADAIVLTRSDLVAPERRRELEAVIHGWSPRAAIYRARHQLTGLRTARADPADSPDLRLEWLSGRRWIAAAGIGNPAALEQQLRNLPGTFCGGTWFADHHDFTNEDLTGLRRSADETHAEVLVVTEKDWTKLTRMAESFGPNLQPVRLNVVLAFDDSRGDGLIDLILARIEKATTRLT
ncbi:MAG: tetraacyldisaccharide 4'-kinase [Tepidisphaerales bacterium]